MTTAKAQRATKRQLGQFITPPALAAKIQEGVAIARDAVILEPSFGDGSFLLPALRRLVELNNGDVLKVLQQQVFGCEIDERLYQSCIAKIAQEYDLPVSLVREQNLHNEDFFRREQLWQKNGRQFDVVLGNPPFGGTFDANLEDELDKRFGKRNGHKIKKETYSFFILACVEMLSPGGCLRFICSDTFLTIKTMMGLREYLMCNGQVTVEDLEHFSPEVQYDLVILDFRRVAPVEHVTINCEAISTSVISLTGNRSWRVREEFARYFMGWPTVGEYFQCSSGMTIGKNEHFVRPILEGSLVKEPYEFVFYDEPYTVEWALQQARLNKLGPRALCKAKAREAAGELIRRVRVVERSVPAIIELPNEDYRPYNKASSGLIYEHASHVVYWRNDGDAVLTFKKTGPWYLRGVGGQSLFGREGVTWPLVASRIRAKYLPPGRILDSGAPVAIPRNGTNRAEIFFLLGWLVTDRASQLLKSVLNHTRNIQGKDVERLPYPAWVPDDCKSTAISLVEEWVDTCMKSGPNPHEHRIIAELEKLYALRHFGNSLTARRHTVAQGQRATQLSLL